MIVVDGWATLRREDRTSLADHRPASCDTFVWG